MRRAIARLLVVVLLAPVILRAQAERDTLRGSGPVAVIVELTGSSDVQNAGLTEIGVKNAIEQRLRQAQIAVDDRAKSQLSVNVNTIRSSVGVYATCVSLEFRQEVFLLHNRLTVLAPTWQRDSVGVRSPERLVAIQDLVLEYVTAFVQDFAAANNAGAR